MGTPGPMTPWPRPGAPGAPDARPAAPPHPRRRNAGPLLPHPDRDPRSHDGEPVPYRDPGPRRHVRGHNPGQTNTATRTRPHRRDRTTVTARTRTVGRNAKTGSRKTACKTTHSARIRPRTSDYTAAARTTGALLMVKTALRLFRIVKSTLFLGILCIMLSVTLAGIAIQSIQLTTKLTLAAANAAAAASSHRKAMAAAASAHRSDKAKARIRRFAIAGAAAVPVAGRLVEPAIAGSFEVADFND